MDDNKVIIMKKILLISTITLFSISAFLGIIFVLVGADSTAYKIIGTTAILGLISWISLRNIGKSLQEKIVGQNRP